MESGQVLAEALRSPAIVQGASAHVSGLSPSWHNSDCNTFLISTADFPLGSLRSKV